MIAFDKTKQLKNKCHEGLSKFAHLAIFFQSSFSKWPVEIIRARPGV